MAGVIHLAPKSASLRCRLDITRDGPARPPVWREFNSRKGSTAGKPNLWRKRIGLAVAKKGTEHYCRRPWIACPKWGVSLDRPVPPGGRRWVCAGWSKGLSHADRREYFIAGLEVFPRPRGKGYGTRLLIACMDAANRLDGATVTGNLSDVDDVDRLTRWYQRFRFEVQRPSTQPGLAASIKLMI
jgi:GNAT superfamily N-acetyltransferase